MASVTRSPTDRTKVAFRKEITRYLSNPCSELKSRTVQMLFGRPGSYELTSSVTLRPCLRILKVDLDVLPHSV